MNETMNMAISQPGGPECEFIIDSSETGNKAESFKTGKQSLQDKAFLMRDVEKLSLLKNSSVLTGCITYDEALLFVTKRLTLFGKHVF